MKRLMAFALLLVLTLTVLLALPAMAAADPLVPDRPEEAVPYTIIVPIYDREEASPWAYTFEGEKWDDPGFSTVYFWMNQVQVFKAWLLKVALRVLEWALLGDLITPLLPGADEASQGLSALAWVEEDGVWVVGALALAGTWAVLLHLRGRPQRAWATLGSTALVLAVFALVMSDGAGLASSAVDISRSVSVQVFQTVHGEDSQGPLFWRSGDAAWRVLVHEPWVAGTLSEAGRDLWTSDPGLPGGDHLTRTPEQRLEACAPDNAEEETTEEETTEEEITEEETTEEETTGEETTEEETTEEETAEDAACPWGPVQHLPRRMMLSLWTGGATVLFAGSVVALAGGMVLAQIQVLFMLALAPVWLLAALWWPEGGGRLVRWLTGRLLSALLSQAVLGATVGVLLSLTLRVSEQFTDQGWMFRSVLLAGLAVVAFRFRYAWVEPLNWWARRRAADEVGLRSEAFRTASGPSERPRPDRGEPVEPVASSDPVTLQALYEAGARSRPGPDDVVAPVPALATGGALPPAAAPAAAEAPFLQRLESGLEQWLPSAPRNNFQDQMAMLRNRLQQPEAAPHMKEPHREAAAGKMEPLPPRVSSENPLPVQRPRE